MRKWNLFSLLLLLLLAGTVAAQAPAAAGAAKKISNDEVYLSLARRINAINESPVSAIVAELDGAFEITGITMRPDGKAEVAIKERAPSSASHTNKSTRLLYAPPASGDKWTWVEFEENRRFYPVEKLFPYAKDELGKRQQLTTARWTAFLNAMGKQGETATKALDTAKAILKGDPAPLAAVTNARKALAEAIKENQTDSILSAYAELQQQTDPILALGDSYSDLKANDAYLRLLEEFKNSVNVTNAARKDYVQTVDAYNEILTRLPFCLVAYGLQFTKIEAKVTAE
ncbi:MAG: LemA family protein [Acidobacteria bacterium]|nr:LemA family protein [Acidobacteriota bacterium]